MVSTSVIYIGAGAVIVSVSLLVVFFVTRRRKRKLQRKFFLDGGSSNLGARGSSAASAAGGSGKGHPTQKDGRGALVASGNGTWRVLGVPLSEMRRSEADDEFPAAMDAVLSVILLATGGPLAGAVAGKEPTYEDITNDADEGGGDGDGDEDGGAGRDHVRGGMGARPSGGGSRAASLFELGVFCAGAASNKEAMSVVSALETELPKTGSPLLAEGTSAVACGEVFRMWLAGLPDPLIPSSCYEALVTLGRKRRELVIDPRSMIPVLREGDETVPSSHLPVIQGVMAVLSALVLAEAHAVPEHKRSRFNEAYLARELGPLMLRPRGAKACPEADRSACVAVVESLIMHHGLLEEAVIPTPRGVDVSGGRDTRVVVRRSDLPGDDGVHDEGSYDSRGGGRGGRPRAGFTSVDSRAANAKIFGSGKRPRRGRGRGRGQDGDPSESEESTGFLSVFTGFFSEKPAAGSVYSDYSAPGDAKDRRGGGGGGGSGRAGAGGRGGRDGRGRGADDDEEYYGTDDEDEDGVFSMFMGLFAAEEPEPRRSASRGSERRKGDRTDDPENAGSDSSGSEGFRRRRGDDLDKRGSSRSLKARASTAAESSAARARDRRGGRSPDRRSRGPAQSEAQDESFFGSFTAMLFGEPEEEGSYGYAYDDIV